MKIESQNLEPEVFVPVVGSNGMYEVSNHGRVFSNNHMNTGTRAEVLPHKDLKGYLRTRLRMNGIRITVKIHRLVAQHFIPNPEDKPMVNHKNLLKHDNYYKNLEWSTAKENTDHAIKNKAFKFINPILTPEIVRSIRARYKPRVCTREMLAKEFGVTVGCINGIIYWYNWRNI